MPLCQLRSSSQLCSPSDSMRETEPSMSVNTMVTEPSLAKAERGDASPWTMVRILSTVVVNSVPKTSSLTTGIERCQLTMRQKAPSSCTTTVNLNGKLTVSPTVNWRLDETQPTVPSFHATIFSTSKSTLPISSNSCICTRHTAATLSNPSHHSSGSVPI